MQLTHLKINFQPNIYRLCSLDEKAFHIYIFLNIMLADRYESPFSQAELFFTFLLNI